MGCMNNAAKNPALAACGRPLHKCTHKLVWVKTPAGKMTQARQCTTPAYAAEIAAIKKADAAAAASFDKFCNDFNYALATGSPEPGLERVLTALESALSIAAGAAQ